MNIFGRYAITVFLYPGGLFALVAGWLLFALGDQVLARLRGTRIPRLMQPTYDFLKLLGKTTSLPAGSEAGGLRLLPLLAVVAPLLALIFIPLPGNIAASTPDTAGDLLAVFFLLLLLALMPVFWGELLPSPYGRVAARRSLRRSAWLIALALLSLLAIAAERHTLNLGTLAAHQAHPTTTSITLDILAGLLFFCCLPALIPHVRWGLFHGEPALIAGPYTDLTGADLALLQLGTALQRVAAGSLLAGVFILPFIPASPAPQGMIYLATLLTSSLWASLARGLLPFLRA